MLAHLEERVGYDDRLLEQIRILEEEEKKMEMDLKEKGVRLSKEIEDFKCGKKRF